AGRFAAHDRRGTRFSPPPVTTALGALLTHITGGHLADHGRTSFQPMNVNFGLFPPVEAPSRDADGRRLRGKEKGRAKKKIMCARALNELSVWQHGDRQAAE
ncbi:MAG: FADH(2)-oxidizing methylenetetrahydrofolate--tRNA-(uracil(54)-C(5))-methyltransferase TrmFO, partial [Pseudomonadota bacterium]